MPGAIYNSPALTIAGDATYDVQSDAYDNSSVKVEPSAGQLLQGFRPQKQLPAQTVNWILAQFAGVMGQLIIDEDDHRGRLDGHDADIAGHETRLDAWDAWRDNNSPRLKIYYFNTPGQTWGLGAPAGFVPEGRVLSAVAVGFGGGGGGGKGANGAEVVDRWLAGAGGGGGSQLSIIPLRNLTPDTKLYNVDVGLGGLGATVAGSTGGDGGDTIMRDGATVLACFPGAQGGRGAVGGQLLAYWVHYSWGGMSRRGIQPMLIGPAGQGIRWDSATGGHAFGDIADGGPHTLYIPQTPGQGGWGAGGSTNPSAGVGQPNAYGNSLGGTAGAQGGDFGDFRGGGGGGGGGAGPAGPGGAGGSGSAGGLTQGSIPGNAAAGSGAGGGGSGSVAYSLNASPIFPRNAGNGGQGLMWLITVEETP